MRETNLKIQQTSKTVLTVIKIVRIFCFLGIIGCAIGSIALGICQKEVDSALQDLIASGKVSLYLSQDNIVRFHMNEGIMVQSVARELIKNIIQGMLALIFIAVVLSFISRIFKVFMENYSPFTGQILKDLKITFILITVLTLSSGLMMGLIIGFALYCVYQIFEYGCELQQQSDETL